jgi:hypothetical protein
MKDDKKSVTVRGGKVAKCALCGAYLYACTHTALTIFAPSDTKRDATAIAAMTSAPSDTVIVNYTEAEVRTDMPWLKGFMVTKRST